jgi:hypothetical protein
MIPIRFWMLECNVCNTRRVVRDTYLERVGLPEGDDALPREGAGFGGRPLPARYGCLKGCAGQMRVIGSIPLSPTDRTMWSHEPHQPRELTEREYEEWLRLIRELNLT